MRGFSWILGWRQKKLFISKNARISTNSGMKPQKKRFFVTKSAKKQFLLTNFGVITSILGVSGIELHSSGTDPVTFFEAQSSLGGIILVGSTSSDSGEHSPGMPPWRRTCCKFTAIYRTVIIAFLLKRYCMKSVLLKKWELFEVIKRCPKPFSTISFICEIRFNSFDSLPLSTLHTQFCDITKGIIFQKFLQTKKRDHQLVAVSSLAITKSENLAIVIGTCKPTDLSCAFCDVTKLGKAELPIVLIKRIKTYFRE